MTTHKKLDELMLKVLVFVDKYGRVITKNGGAMSSSLSMEYKEKDLDITMKVFCHAWGNGSCGTVVKHKNKKVFDAAGKYISAPIDVKADIYESGEWEKLIE